MAGPGQSPTIPQPIPNKDDPIIKCLSILLLLGSSNFEEKNGFFSSLLVVSRAVDSPDVSYRFLASHRSIWDRFFYRIKKY